MWPGALVVPAGSAALWWPTNCRLHFRASGQPQSSTASSDKAFEDWLNEDLSSYQG